MNEASKVGKEGERNSNESHWGPSTRLESWIQTTTGIVVMLLAVQFVSGLLLAFYYVPSADHAHTTVAFIEKVLPTGQWVRALHHYGSQWLPLVLFVHIAQLLWRGAFRTQRGAWNSSVVLLMLVMAAGATGYSLPWDARAFFTTRIAEGIVGGLPLLGQAARRWLLGGNEISTITLSRFFALHVLVTPFLILGVVGFGLTRKTRLDGLKVVRNSLFAGLVFIALALYAKKFHAPLGPAVESAGAGYLPRPGLQFLWLYQTLKHVPPAIGSLVAIVGPGLFGLFLVLLPFLDARLRKRNGKSPLPLISGALLLLVAVFVGAMTFAAFRSDRNDPRTREQLARQAAEEATVRNQPFVPDVLNLEQTPSAQSQASPQTGGPPPAYTKLCAACHGEHGEGARQGPLKFPPLLGVSTKPRRTTDDIVSLLNDPQAYGLQPPMKSFATKLTEDEKRQIAAWIVSLKK